MARLAAGPEIYRSCICVCRTREQVNRVSCELIQVAWIQGTSWVLAKTTRSTSTCGVVFFFFFPLSSSFTPHPVCLPLRRVFQCSSWAIIQLQTCKYQCWFLMRSKSLPARGLGERLGLNSSHRFASTDADSPVCTASYCAVIWTDVYFVQYIFRWG